MRPQARIFSGAKAGRNPIMVKGMDIFANDTFQASMRDKEG